MLQGCKTCTKSAESHPLIYTKLSFGPLKTKMKITSYYKVNTTTVFTNRSLLPQRAECLSVFFNAAAGNDANDECEIDPKQ